MLQGCLRACAAATATTASYDRIRDANHLRTWGGELQVDLVVVRGDQHVVAVEVKPTAPVGDPDVAHLRRLGARIGPQLLDAAMVTAGADA